MKILNFKSFMKKYNSKGDTMNGRRLCRIYINPLYPRDSKINSDKGFVIIDDGSMKGTHWTCFILKDKKSFYFDSLGGTPDKCLLNQLPEPLTYHNYKKQDINPKLCGSYCLYFFYLIEGMKYYDTILKMYFEKM